MIEEAQPHLYAEDTACCFIDHFEGYFSTLNSFYQMIVIDSGAHIHVHSGDRRFYSGVLIIFCNAVHHALTDGVCVADHKAREAQRILEDVTKQEFVHGAGDAVQVVESRHDGLCAGFHARFESFEVIVVENIHRHSNRVVVTAGFACPVGCIVLEAGGNIVVGG